MRFLLAFFIYILTFQSHAWVVERDFENPNIGELANGDDGFDFAHSKTVYSNEKAISGSRSAISTIRKGHAGFGDWGGELNFPSKLKEGQEFWYRVWVYYPAGFDLTCNCSEGIKFMRTRTFAADGQTFEGSQDYYLSRGGPIMATGVNSKEFYENHPWPHEDIRKIGERITNGSWHAYEHYMKFSATPGKGILRAWQDGKLIFEDKVTATLKTSKSVAGQATLWTYWNNKAPQTQSAYVDHIIITNERPSQKDAKGNSYIGTGNVTFAGPPTAPPKPPVIFQ